jgi:hypothetical protein
VPVSVKTVKVPLSIVDGLDTKTDEKNVATTNWLAAENIDYRRTGAISKRAGFAGKTRRVDGESDDITNGKAVATFFDELIQYSGNKLYSFSESKNYWYEKGFVNNAVCTEKVLGNTDYTTISSSHETIDSFTCVAYQTTASNAIIYVRLFDDANGVLLKEFEIVEAGAVLERVAKLNNTFLIFYHETPNGINYMRLDLVDINTVLGPVVLTNYDSDSVQAVNIGDRLFLSYINNFAGGVDQLYIKPDFTSIAPINAVAYTPNFFYASREGFSNLRLVYDELTSLFDYNLGELHSAAVFSPGFTPTASAAVQDPDNENASLIFTQDNFDTSNQIGIKMFRVDSAGAVTDLDWVFYGASMVTKPQLYDGQVYFVLIKKINDSDSGQRTYYLGTKDKQIVAKVADNIAVRRTFYDLLDLHTTAGGLTFTGSQYSEFFSNTSPGSAVSTNVAKYNFDFSPANNFYDATLGKQLHIAGGILSSYDGRKVVEHGFLEVPVAPEFDAFVDIGPSLGVGSQVALDYPQTVQYCIVYSWIDSQGQIHRSAPSLPLSVTIPDENQRVNLLIRPLTLTSKDNVEIEVYRTEGNGTNFYKISNIGGVGSTTNSRLSNDPSEAQLEYGDAAGDDGIRDNELLYTTGGALENIAPISSRYITSSKTRLFLLSGDGYSIQYSQLRQENVGVAFFDGFTMQLDRQGDEARALAVMDDNLIILKRRALQVLPGQGPDNLGQNDDFRQPTNIPTDVGCEDPASVISMPMGIMFKSAKGIYILRRNFAVEYIGAPVEKYNSLAVTSATLLEASNQIQFTTESGTTLTYDYYTNRWSTSDNMPAVDAVVYDGAFSYLRSNGTVMQQSGYSDNGSFVPMKLESAWVQLAGIQGFQRVKQLMFVGKYLSPHKVKISFAYDYVNTWVHSVVIDATTLWGGNTYSSGDYDEGAYSGDGEAYQARVFTKIQKCQSFRFKIETVFDGATGPDCTISNFSLLVGIKVGDFKTSRSYGAR